MDLRALYPRRRTSQPGKGHKICPYLLRDLSIERANQAWASDISYIPMAKGFMYLVAIMDWYSRRVLSWRVSNTLDTDFCIEALEEALQRFEAPEIFNTDQGSQFTCEAFTDVLKGHAIAISMDGKGRWVDNPETAFHLTPFGDCLFRVVKHPPLHIFARYPRNRPIPVTWFFSYRSAPADRLAYLPYARGFPMPRNLP